MNTATLMIVSVSFVVTTATVWLLLKVAPRRMLDVPNARSSHAVPTPRGGGVGVLAGIVAGGVTLLVVQDVALSRAMIAVVAALATVALTSMIDDIRPLPSRIRLLIQLAGSLLAVWALSPFAVLTIPLVGEFHAPVVAAILSVVWCVGLTNAFNFLDGIDGIAGVQGAIAAMAWSGVGLVTGSPALMAFGGIIAAACAAFLLFNWSPARIFLGDVGSAPLGFLFAILPFVARTGTAVPGIMPAAGFLILWPFIFDALYTFGRRMLQGEDLFAAHRSHLYQRLVIAGWTHARVTILYGTLALLDSAAAVNLVAGGEGSSLVGWGALLMTGLALVMTVGSAEASVADRVSSGVRNNAEGVSSGN